MKRLINIVVVLGMLFSMPAASALAESSKVPIIYNGDTDKTIARRVQWIEKAKDEKEIMWWTSVKTDQLTEIAAEFKKLYPFIELKYWKSGAKEREMRIESEHSIGRLSADLCDAGGMENYPRWRKVGLVEKFVQIVPGLDNINPRRYSKHMDWIQPGHNAIVPMYNTNLVSPDEAPKSWQDLLDPRWKGHIGITSDPKVWYTLAFAEGGWGIEKTENYLKKLRKQNLIWAKSHGSGLVLLIAGEFKIFAENYPRNLFFRKELKNAPAGWVKVNPVVVTGGTFFLTKKAPHPNSARLFLEWIFSPPGAVVFERVTGYGSIDAGSGTLMGKAFDGLEFAFRDENVLMKVTETGFIKRIHNLLGVSE